MKKYYALFNPVYFVFLKSKNFDFENFQFNKNTSNFIIDSFKNETEKENLKYELERFIQSLDEDDRWLFQMSTDEHLLVDFITEKKILNLMNLTLKQISVFFFPLTKMLFNNTVFAHFYFNQ